MFISSFFKKNPNKYQVELKFWHEHLEQCQNWYQGKLKELYQEPSPTEKQKVKTRSLKDSAILTWEKIHQQPKYLQDLQLKKNAFHGLKILDIGSGPQSSAIVFSGCELYCLDPLLPEYLKLGYPIHYCDRARFIHAHAENIPLKDNFFDAIISVNAIDHVDNFSKTATEIKRVLKPRGKLRMHIHYHLPTPPEPITLNDQIVKKAFHWSKNFRPIKRSHSKRGHTLRKGSRMSYGQIFDIFQ